MINFICFIISTVIAMFFLKQENYIFFGIENAIMIYYALSTFKWIFNTLNIRGSNVDKFDEQYEQYEHKLLEKQEKEKQEREKEKQERENWHPRKDILYLSSLDLKDIDWTGTEHKAR